MPITLGGPLLLYFDDIDGALVKKKSMKTLYDISAVPFLTEFSLPRRYSFNTPPLLKIRGGFHILNTCSSKRSTGLKQEQPSSCGTVYHDIVSEKCTFSSLDIPSSSSEFPSTSSEPTRRFLSVGYPTDLYGRVVCTVLISQTSVML